MIREMAFKTGVMIWKGVGAGLKNARDTVSFVASPERFFEDRDVSRREKLLNSVSQTARSLGAKIFSKTDLGPTHRALFDYDFGYPVQTGGEMSDAQFEEYVTNIATAELPNAEKFLNAIQKVHPELDYRRVIDVRGIRFAIKAPRAVLDLVGSHPAFVRVSSH